MAGSADNDLACGRFDLGLASHGLFVYAGSTFRLLACICKIAILELRQYFLGEELNGGAEHLVRYFAGL